MKSVSRDSRFSWLSVRLASWILFCSSVFALIATSLQLYWDYQRDVKQVNSVAYQLQSSFHETLTASLWGLDERQAQVQVEGILSGAGIHYVVVKQKINQQTRIFAEAGDSKGRHDLTLHSELVFRESSLGELEISVSYKDVYSRLWEKAVVVLVTQFFKTLCVSAAIFFIVYFFVIRHLRAISAYADALRPEQDGQRNLRLHRSPNPRSDELDQLVEAINHLKSRAEESLSARDKALTALNQEVAFSTKVIDKAAVVVAALDDDLIIKSINPAGERLSGFKSVDLEGGNWLKVFVERERRDELQALLTQNDRVSGFRSAMAGQSGRVSILLWDLVSYEYPEQSTRWLALGADISRISELERNLVTDAARLNDIERDHFRELQQWKKRIAVLEQEVVTLEREAVADRRKTDLAAMLEPLLGLVAQVGFDKNAGPMMLNDILAKQLPILAQRLAVNNWQLDYEYEMATDCYRDIELFRIFTVALAELICRLSESTMAGAQNLKLEYSTRDEGLLLTLIASGEAIADLFSGQGVFVDDIDDSLLQLVLYLGLELLDGKLLTEEDRPERLQIVWRNAGFGVTHNDDSSLYR